MPGQFRTDPNSISFGRGLKEIANEIQNQGRQITELKNSQPSEDQQQLTRELATERRRERLRARQLLADYGSSLDDLNSVNGSLLTPALQEQIRHNKNAMMASNNLKSIQFDDAAIERINNFRAFTKNNPANTFATNNASSFPEPLSSFQKWVTRQDSMDGRMQRAQILQVEQHKMMNTIKQSQSNNAQTNDNDGGFYIGRTNDLSK